MTANLFGDVSYQGKIGYADTDPIDASLVLGNATADAVTLAVETTGNDTPTATRPARIVAGDHSSEPFRTIQAAIDSLPKSIRPAAAVVNVGAGNFAGYMVEGFHCGRNASLLISGTMGPSVPNSGPSTSIVPTSTTGHVINVTGAGWTNGDLICRFVSVTSGPGAGQILAIADNDADSITLAGKASPTINAESVFDIVDAATRITTQVVAADGQTFGIGIFANVGNVTVENHYSQAGTFRVVATTNTFVGLTRVVTEGGSYGILGQDSDRCEWSQVGALNTFQYGLALFNVRIGANGSEGWFSNGCGYGLYINNVGQVALGSGAFVNSTSQAVYAIYSKYVRLWFCLIDNASTGVYCWAVGFLYLYSVDISNTSTGPFYLKSTDGYIYGPLTGTGNAGWGLYLAGGNSTFEVAGPTAPTITGSDGEVTLDNQTDVGWSAVSSAGGYAAEPSNGSRVFRI